MLYSRGLVVICFIYSRVYVLIPCWRHNFLILLAFALRWPCSPSGFEALQAGFCLFVFVFFSTSPAVWGICLLPRVSARDCHSIPGSEVWRESPLHGEGPHAQLLPGRQGGALNVRATASALTTRAENHRPRYTARSRGGAMLGPAAAPPPH